MSVPKTKPTEVSVESHIAAVANEEQRNDAQTLVALMRRVTKQEPRMWGPSIVGFGSYHYKYASGHEGDSALAGFAARGSELVVYIAADFEGRDVLLAKLGKHKTGKVCVYIRRLANVDLKVLETLVARSVAETKRRYPKPKKTPPNPVLHRTRLRRGGEVLVRRSPGLRSPPFPMENHACSSASSPASSSLCMVWSTSSTSPKAPGSSSSNQA